MLADTSRFLSGLTDYAAVVVRQAADPARIRSVQLVSLAPKVAVVVAVLAAGRSTSTPWSWPTSRARPRWPRRPPTWPPT